MAEHTCIVLVILAIVGPHLTVGDLRCQDQVQIQGFVGQCLAEAGVGAPTQVDQAAAMQKACKENTFDAALTCIETIMDTCITEGSKKELLDKFISIPKMRSAFKYICEHIDVLAQKAECIANDVDLSGVTECTMGVIEENKEEMEEKVKSGEIDPQNIETMLPYICRMGLDSMDCMMEPFDTCGEEVGEVMVTFARALLPPACDKYSGSNTLTVNVSTIFFIIVAALFFHNS